MRPPLRVGTVYDFRNTPESGMDMPSLYAAIMDQVVMLDGLGLDLVWFTEHHFLDDGYLPSWVPMAGAIAARTKRVRLSSDVCLLPFNHPIRLAEDLAVLDNLSNGRVEIGVGMGYAPHEFRGFGLPVSRRLSLTDEGLAVLRHAFTGETFSFHGKRYDFTDVKITPDLLEASVYLSFYQVKDIPGAMKKVDERAWEIKRELAARVKHQLRRIPTLQYFYDDTLEHADKMEALFRKINQEKPDQ